MAGVTESFTFREADVACDPERLARALRPLRGFGYAPAERSARDQIVAGLPTPLTSGTALHRYLLSARAPLPDTARLHRDLGRALDAVREHSSYLSDRTCACLHAEFKPFYNTILRSLQTLRPAAVRYEIIDTDTGQPHSAQNKADTALLMTGFATPRGELTHIVHEQHVQLTRTHRRKRCSVSIHPVLPDERAALWTLSVHACYDLDSSNDHTICRSAAGHLIAGWPVQVRQLAQRLVSGRRRPFCPRVDGDVLIRAGAGELDEQTFAAAITLAPHWTREPAALIDYARAVTSPAAVGAAPVTTEVGHA